MIDQSTYLIVYAQIAEVVEELIVLRVIELMMLVHLRDRASFDNAAADALPWLVDEYLLRNHAVLLEVCSSFLRCFPPLVEFHVTIVQYDSFVVITINTYFVGRQLLPPISILLRSEC